MMIKASEIKIDGTYHGACIVTQECFGVVKARRVFEDLYSALYEHVVVRSRDMVSKLLIRDTGCHDPYVNAALCSYSQSSGDLIGQYEIRRHDPAIFLGIIDHVKVNILTDRLIIKRAVAIRDAITPGAFNRRNIGRLKSHHVVFFTLKIGKVPHLDEHCSKTVDGRTNKLDTVILPLAVRIYEVKVFICDIVTARITNLAVNNGNLSVVTVIHEESYDRICGIESIALDAFRFEHLDECRIDERE